ncbi:uncharacterized protein EHS24_001189 [Apiotrichum porosum]|uniref:Uncharacterized protein n=1 Tax=Apiotrichum porosum TaxID=105984 RepID=A0A427XJS9_9TREE|nr:uncharacterized protein EHS24_001189 [Apiotrichum porosum]RSH79151.1 hypothetical protein EHS24_001189 [Apiotrichum porosum]
MEPSTPETASPDDVLFNWHDGSVDALLAFTRLAHRILESHVLAAADGVSPLRPLVEPDLQHCPVLRSFLDEAIVDIQRSSCATAGNDPATIDCAIRETRVLPKQIQRRPPRKNKDNDKDKDKDEDTTDEDVDKKGDQHKDKKRVKKHAKHTPRGGSTRRQPSRAAKSHSSSTTQAAHNSHTTNIVTWATEVATEANNRAVDQSPDMPYELRTPPRDTVPVGGDTPGADLGRPLMEYLLEPGAALKRRVTEMTTYTISGQVHAAADEYADVYGGDDVVSDAVDPRMYFPHPLTSYWRSLLTSATP